MNENKSGCFDTPSRRAFLKATAGLAGIAALAGCTVTKNGSVTTVTLNTEEVLNYGQSILSFARAGIGITFVSAALGTSGVAIATAAITALDTALTAFNKAANGAASVSYDDASVKAAFDSILTSAQTISGYIIQTITATVSDSTVVDQAKVAANAASGLISILKALVSTFMSDTAPRVGNALRGDAYVAEVKTWAASVK